MTANKALKTSDIVLVDIPIVGRHFAIVILCLDNGKSYVVVNGSSTPQDIEPTVTLSTAAAAKCGIYPSATSNHDKITKFYCAKYFVWYWRPNAAQEPIGRMVFATYQSDLRNGAIKTLKAMANVSVEIGKLPSDVGLSLKALSELKSILRA